MLCKEIRVLCILFWAPKQNYKEYPGLFTSIYVYTRLCSKQNEWYVNSAIRIKHAHRQKQRHIYIHIFIYIHCHCWETSNNMHQWECIRYVFHMVIKWFSYVSVDARPSIAFILIINILLLLFLWLLMHPTMRLSYIFGWTMSHIIKSIQTSIGIYCMPHV